MASHRVRVEWEVRDGWQRRASLPNGHETISMTQSSQADAGGVNYPDMGIPLSKCAHGNPPAVFPLTLESCIRTTFAVASTDTGHNSSGTDGSFAIKGPETQVDFGHRAVHLTAVYAKKIVAVRRGRRPTERS